MERVVLTRVQLEKDQDLLLDFLYGIGLIERKKAKKEPLIVSVIRLFLKNKNKPLSYDFLLRRLPPKKDKDLRSNVVKICQKLADFGLVQRTAYVPKGKKRWERAFIFTSFSQVVELTRKKTKSILGNLQKIGDKLDEK